MDSAIINGSQHLEKILKELKSEGIEHDLTPQKIVEIYKHNGIFKRGGLIENIGKEALKSVPDSEQYVYYGLLSTALGFRKEKLMAQMKESLPVTADMDELEEDIKKQIVRQIRLFMGSTEIPEEILKEKLVQVYESHGLFGKKGMFSYLAENSTAIFANAEAFGLIGEEEIKQFKNYVTGLSNLNSLINIFIQKKEKTSYQRFAIGIARKAEELNISPLELLSSTEYTPVKKELMVEAYGSIEKAKPFSIYLQPVAVPAINEALNKLKAEKIDVEQIRSEIDTNKPKGFFGKVVVALADRYVKKTIVRRIEDYLILTKGLIEQQAELAKREMQLYIAENANN